MSNHIKLCIFKMAYPIIIRFDVFIEILPQRYKLRDTIGTKNAFFFNFVGTTKHKDEKWTTRQKHIILDSDSHSIF